MNFRGLNRYEQRQLEAIERQLDAEAPEVASAFRTSAAAPEGAGSRVVFIAVAGLVALIGLLADAPLVVLLAMAGATAALIAPAPRLSDTTPDEDEPPAVPLG